MESLIQTDMFQVTAFDPPLRDNRDVMEYPFLAIQKGRKKPITFSSPDGRVFIEVTAPEKNGLATIWDWDLMVYFAAHLNDALENGLKISKRVQFAPYDALKYMKRGTGGKDYRELVLAIRRLTRTSVTTSIRQDETEGGEGNLRWIENYWIPRKYIQNQFLRDLDDGSEADPRKPWHVILPDWIVNAVSRQTGILAVHPDYFEMTGGLERWLYRLARKAVPDKGEGMIKFRMDTLHKRSGSTRPLRQFAHDIRRIAEKNNLPEYGANVFSDGRNELVTLYRDSMKPRRLPRGVRLITEL